MANPRKFSEKIALHHQKQAEETAAFEEIMREVSNATKEKPVTNGSEEVVPNQNQLARGRSVGYRERGRSVGSVGPMRSEKRSADKSPYSSGPYLSPPPSDTSWRRTHSDSALHHSVSQTSSTESLAHLHSPGSQRRTLIDNQQYDKNRYLSTSPDKRPRSCCDVPRVPGINVFTTQQEPGVVQIPIGNNTGSLPDLTNLLTQFSPPIHVPLDQDEQYNLSSPYNSNNHLNVPYLMNDRFQHICKGFNVDNSLGNGNSGENCNSTIEMRMLEQNSNMNCGTVQMNNLNMSQTLMYQTIPLSSRQQQTQQSCSTDGQTEINSSHLNIGNSQLNNLNSLGSYRNQQSNRPSPQSSPGLTIQYGSSSPLCSSPQSPSSPSNSSVSSNLHKHFEDFSMEVQDWNQLIQTLKESNSTAWMTTQLQHDSPRPAVMDYIGSPSNHTYLTQPDDEVNGKINTDLDYSNTSPLQSLQYPNQNHTTPINTLSTKISQPVPHIILTDFSYEDHPLNNGNDFIKDLNSTTSFDANYFPIEDNMRQGIVDQIHLERLDPLDQLDYLPMYSDSNIDAVTNNDHF
ncbi:CREB-regulated transcription coactivator 2-like isoform X8 [Sipha flava]|uniref:CREB-regulated transcription coactivator 2-like isoform X8 n=1 Tax=Sipha flava TaxID=143950 RepID=A0A8B8GMA9_9HEMI|nr:CREB-regulated transcription coactivator 2-like isoform X8 [Sipha flava]